MAEAEPDFSECLQLQLSEVEMLNSMFPSEFALDDPSILADVHKYIDEETKEVPPQISFTIKIHIDEPKVTAMSPDRMTIRNKEQGSY